MDLLLPLAAKSFLVAGACLLMLRLAAKRSASERSWIAHLGLAALILLPVAALTLPALEVEAPEFIGSAVEQPQTAAPAVSEPATSAKAEADLVAAKEAPSTGTRFPQAAVAAEPAAPRDWALWAYAAPALVLFLFTLIALGRLFTLRARAEVLVEPHWLTALARAQHRMRFKHGTALLTSNELPSPISWGVMRPVILLNQEAAGSHAEAEAIIAHELAHVANLDWAKLLLSRLAVAVFWFNPFVWLLAREAHQLREEAADDAVLGADIADTDYAQLLVGVARHECRGLLIGAHGVAPARNSLARRIRRVLDAGSARGPAARPFAAGVFVGALLFAAPLAALTLTPKGGKASSEADAPALAAIEDGKAYYVGSEVPAPSVIQGAVSTAVTSALSLVHPHPGWTEEDEREFEKQVEKALEDGWNGVGPVPGTVGPRPGTVGPKFGKLKAGKVGPKSPIDLAIEMKAVGVTPEYIRSMRAISPQLHRLSPAEFMSLAALHVTPAYVRELESAGFRELEADELVEARALGVNWDYIRSLAAVGYRNLSLDTLGELRAVGVSATDIDRYRRAGYTGLSVEKLVEMKAVGIDPEDIRAAEDDDGS